MKRLLFAVLFITLLCFSCSDAKLTAENFVLTPYIDDTGGEFLSLSFKSNAAVAETLSVSVVSSISGLKWTADAVADKNKMCYLNGLACPIGFEFGEYLIEVRRATGGQSPAKGSAHLIQGAEEFSVDRVPVVTAEGFDGEVDFEVKNLAEGDSYYVRLLTDDGVFIAEEEISGQHKEVFYESRRRARKYTFVWQDAASGITYVKSGQPIS